MTVGEAVSATHVGAARVPGNAWTDLAAPDIEDLVPTLSVTVVIPYYEAPVELERTLAAVAAQRYPTHLLEVVVADDGSRRPPDLPADLNGIPVRLVRQEHRGFGPTRARNLGAAAADGTVLVFLDGDMVAVPHLVAAHARWHHVVSDAATIGFRTHVDFTRVSAEDVVAAASQDRLAQLFSGRDCEAPQYIEYHMERTADLTSGHDDLFRVFAGGNIGMRADLFAAAGRCDETINRRGGGDIELGYRLFTMGALLVPERRAFCWHQGPPGFADERKQRDQDANRVVLQHRIAHRGFRRSLPGRCFLVPKLTVHVLVGDEDAGQAGLLLDEILAGEFHDLLVLLDVAPQHPLASWLDEGYGSDPRVTVGDGLDPLLLSPSTPFRLRLPAGASVSGDTLGKLVARFEQPDDRIGALHLTIPGYEPDAVLAEAATTRALSRTRRLAEPDARPALLGELFGEQWASGGSFGLQRRGAPQRTAGRGHPVPGSATAELQNLQRAVLELSPRQRALLVRTAAWVLSVVRRVSARGRPRPAPPAESWTRWNTLMRHGKAVLPEPAVRFLRPLLRSVVGRLRRLRRRRGWEGRA